MKTNAKEVVVREYTITLSEQEFDLLLGIGESSEESRIDAGMSVETSQFIGKFFGELYQLKRNFGISV